MKNRKVMFKPFVISINNIKVAQKRELFKSVLFEKVTILDFYKDAHHAIVKDEKGNKFYANKKYLFNYEN